MKISGIFDLIADVTQKDLISHCNATFMSLLPKKHLKREIYLA